MIQIRRDKPVLKSNIYGTNNMIQIISNVLIKNLFIIVVNVTFLFSIKQNASSILVIEDQGMGNPFGNKMTRKIRHITF